MVAIRCTFLILGNFFFLISNPGFIDTAPDVIKPGNRRIGRTNLKQMHINPGDEAARHLKTEVLSVLSGPAHWYYVFFRV